MSSLLVFSSMFLMFCGAVVLMRAARLLIQIINSGFDSLEDKITRRLK